MEDATLMDKVRAFDLAPTELATFNRCHMAHHIFFLLDLMDGYGHLVPQELLAPPKAPPQSAWHWPRASTTSMDWIIWRSYLPRIVSAMARPGPLVKISTSIDIYPLPARLSYGICSLPAPPLEELQTS